MNEKLDRLLTEAECLTGNHEPLSEAEINAFRSRLASLEIELAKLTVGAPGDRRLHVCLARLADKRGNLQDAVRYWQQVQEISRSNLDEACLGLAMAYARTSNLDAAKRSLDWVREAPRLASPLTGQREAIDTRLRIDQTVRSAEELARLVNAGGEPGQLEGLVATTLAESGLPYRDDGRVLQLLMDACKVVSQFQIPSPSNAKHDILANYKRLRAPRSDATGDSKAVFVSGFMWSGSGAVTDMLFDHPDVHVAFNGRELTLFNYLDTLLGLFDAPKGQLQRRDFVSIFLGPIAGLLVDRKRAASRRNSSLLKALWDAGQPIERPLGVCARLVERLAEVVNLVDEDFHHAVLVRFQDFANELVESIRLPGKRIVVLNNSIFGFHAREMAIFRDAVMVSVRRDPRDQYASQQYEMPAADVPTIERFIKTNRSRLLHYRRTLTELELADRILDIEFESVVLDGKTRQRVLTFLGLDSRPGSGRLDPDKSRKNIGIYSHFRKQDDIRAIEARMPEFIYR